MTEARRRFREMLDRAGNGEAVRITRRGEVAAVLVSPQDFDRIDGGGEGFGPALARFRATADVDDLVDGELESLRATGPGRPVEL